MPTGPTLEGSDQESYQIIDNESTWGKQKTGNIHFSAKEKVVHQRN